MTTLQHRLITDTRYVLLGLPMAVMSFVIVVAGISVGLGAAVAFAGLPVLAAAATLARNFADTERLALPGVLGHRIPRPRYTPAPVGAGWFRRLMNPLLNGQACLDLLYGIVAFPFALVSFILTVVWWAGAVAGLTFPLYGWIIVRIPGFEPGVLEWLGLGDSDLLYIVLNTGLGVAFALTLVPVVRLAALLKAGVSQALLTGMAVADPAPVAGREPAWLASR
jgi:Putative sensor